MSKLQGKRIVVDVSIYLYKYESDNSLIESIYTMISIFRHGINNDNIGPIAKASFEETPEMFLKACHYIVMLT